MPDFVECTKKLPKKLTSCRKPLVYRGLSKSCSRARRTPQRAAGPSFSFVSPGFTGRGGDFSRQQRGNIISAALSLQNKAFPLQEARRKRNGGTRSRIPFAAVQMTKPPFTPIVWPVMKAAPSPSRKRAAAAISSGVPSRCSGVSSASARSSSGV